MGKPSKKTTSKVEIAPPAAAPAKTLKKGKKIEDEEVDENEIAVPAAPAKTLKKGKREAEEVNVKEVSKKQKQNVQEVIKKEACKKKLKKDIKEANEKEVDEKNPKKEVEEVKEKEVDEKKQKSKKPEGKTVKKKAVKKLESSDDSSNLEEQVNEANEKKQKKRKAEDKTEKVKVVKKQKSSDDPSKSPKEAIVTEASEKKQKKKNIGSKTEKKKTVKKQDTRDEPSSSKSEEDQKSVAVEPVEPPTPAAKVDSSDKSGDEVINGKVAAATKTGPVLIAKKEEESSEPSKSEDKDSSNSGENATVSKKVPAAAAAIKNKKDADKVINGKVAAAAKSGPVKKEESSEDSKTKDKDSSNSDEKVPAAAAAAAIENVKKEADEVAAAAKTGPVSVAKKKEESSEPSKSENKDNGDLNENATASKKVPAAAAKIENVMDNINKKDAGDSDSKKDSSSKEDTCETKSGDVVSTKTVSSKSPASDTEQVKEEMDDTREDESSQQSEKANLQEKKIEVQVVGTPNPVKSSIQDGKEESKSDVVSLEEASDDVPSKVQAEKKSHTASTKSSSSGDEEESSSGEEDDEKDKTLKKNVTDVEMVDVLPKTPDAEKLSLSSDKKETKPAFVQPETVGSRTLFMGNLSFSLEKEDVENLFKEYGDVADIRFGIRPDGAFKGFGHIQFATVEAARKAFEEKNGHDLLGRPLKLDIASEKGPRSRDSSTFHKVPGIDRPTVYVRGFEKIGDEQAIKEALKKHFARCGEITRISLPRDDNGLKGFAYIDFTNSNDVTNALLLNKSYLKDYLIIVEAAKPRGDQNGGSGGARFNDQRGSNSRFGDRGGGGRFDHRGGGGGRFDHRGGRFGDRGRGRGTPY